MLRLRKFMFDRVYLGPEARGEQERVRISLRALFDHYAEEFGDEQRVIRATDPQGYYRIALKPLRARETAVAQNGTTRPATARS